MLAFPEKIFPALKAISTNITSEPKSQLSYLLTKKNPQEEALDLEKKIYDYFVNHPEKLKTLDECNPKCDLKLNKKKKRYKKRRWDGHSYGVKLVTHTAYLLQGYHFAYGAEGKLINPSKGRLAEELGICIRTLDKALKILEDMEVVSWKSGKQTWETNIYYLADAYKSTPMRKPEDFKHPRHIFLKISYLIAKQKLKEFTRTLFEYLSTNIADHLLRKNKKLRTSQKEGGKSAIKSAKDPPRPRKMPPHWHILKDLKLNFKDQWVLSRYSELALRSAINDLRSYESWDKKVENTSAFLISRCKDHKRKKLDQDKNQDTKSIKEWLTDYFKSRKVRFVFVNDRNQVDPKTSESRPFIQLLLHKQDIQRSVLKVYQKVQGAWIDKIFNFDRPDLTEAVESYLENSIRYLKASS